jgi:CheY-like chemotaxis protein
VGCDSQVTDTLGNLMKKEAIRVEVCSDIASAAGRLDDLKFDAVILDFNRRAEAVDLLKTIRLMKSHKGVVVIVLLNDNDEMPEAFRAGSSFVLVKPLSTAVLTRTLRVSHPLMVRERSRYFRCPLQIPTFICIGSRPELIVTSANISEGGMAIIDAPALEPEEKVALRLKLPGTQAPTKIAAKVCWRDDLGRAGLRFTHIPAPAKEQLLSWLADRLAESVPVESVPSVCPKPAVGGALNGRTRQPV